jgi:type I restriction enzyme R subunit
MCEAFLKEAQRDPAGNIGKSLVFAVNQDHATELTKIFNGLQPGIAVTITSRIDDASSIAKEFRDGKRAERIAVSVDMLSTGYNCRDLLNIGLMRPIFSPTEYIQIKGRGTRLFTFKIGNTEYEKKNFFMLDFCAVAEYFEEKYDYTVPLRIPREKKTPEPKPPYPPHTPQGEPINEGDGGTIESGPFPPQPTREIPTWEGVDTLVSREIHIVGPDGEKVDVMTFRGGYERDIREFVASTPELKAAIEAEDDDEVETIVNERFYHRPEMFYSPDKLVISYGVPASTPAFVYNAVGRKPLPTRDTIVSDTVDSIAARFNLRYNEQKWLDATAQLVADDSNSLRKFIDGDMTIFNANQFRTLGGLDALSRFDARDDVFEALRQSSLVRQSLLASSLAA